MGSFINIAIGDKFNRLEVLELSDERINGSRAWVCKCDCGTILTVKSNYLRSGHTKSCGCLLADILIKRNKEELSKHGLFSAHPAEYNIWKGMIERCHNPDNSSYLNYGARGIIVCEEWRSDFEAFLSHIGERPFKSAQVDRIDNNGNYKPDNVRWASPKQQSNNRRNSRTFTYHGKTQTCKQWAEEFEIRYQKVFWRFKQGWKPEDILRK